MPIPHSGESGHWERNPAFGGNLGYIWVPDKPSTPAPAPAPAPEPSLVQPQLDPAEALNRRRRAQLALRYGFLTTLTSLQNPKGPEPFSALLNSKGPELPSASVGINPIVAKFNEIYRRLYPD